MLKQKSYVGVLLLLDQARTGSSLTISEYGRVESVDNILQARFDEIVVDDEISVIWPENPVKVERFVAGRCPSCGPDALLVPLPLSRSSGLAQ